MNWFIAIKSAQIWESNTEETFGGMLIRIHELEYKRAMLVSRPFNGMPQRLDNMVKNVEAELWEAINFVKPPLVSTLETWLGDHALTDPDAWASKAGRHDGRFSDWEEYYMETGTGPEVRLQSVVNDYMENQKDGRWYNSAYQTPPWDNLLKGMISEMDISQSPGIMAALNVILEIRKENAKEDMYSDPESFNENNNQSFTDEEQAENWIESWAVEDVLSYHDLFEYYDLESLAQMLEENNMLDAFLYDINRQMVFPVWYQRWAGKGIVETREAVQKIYNLLISAESIGDTMSAISFAINAVHQTGDMIHYLEDYGNLDWEVKDALANEDIKGILSTIESSDNPYIEEWDRELEEVGVEMGVAA